MNSSGNPLCVLDDNLAREHLLFEYEHLGYTPDAATPGQLLLYTALHKRFLELARARAETVASLKTPEDVIAYQTRLKAAFWDALGDMPERTPLNARTVGELACDGFRIEKIVYESRPNHHVTANLYLPESDGPVPGVLMPCGHTLNGKVGYYPIAGLLALNGLAVLVYDPAGQGERKQIFDTAGAPAYKPTFEHNMLGAPSRLVGRCLANYFVWDGIRSLDYLESRPEIDPSRLGCTGNSGGGTMTSYLMALDDRIAAAAPSCYLTSFERLLMTLGLPDDEQNIPGQFALGLLHADYLTLRAPKPTLMLVATRDFFDIDGAWDTWREAKKLYCLLGAGDSLDLFEFDDTHGFSPPRRRAAARWLRRHLLGQNNLIANAEPPPVAPEQLQCVSGGQAVVGLGGVTIVDLNAARSRELAAERARRGALAPEAFRRLVRETLSLPEAVEIIHPTDRGSFEDEGRVVRRLVFETEPGIFLPALLMEEAGTASPKPMAVVVHGEGKCAALDIMRALAGRGARVLAVDLRGTGEMRPVGNNYGPLFGEDYNEAYLSLNLGRPLLGQRVFDVLALLEYAASDPKTLPGRIALHGIGQAVPAVLHAAVLDTRVESVAVEGGLVSWAALAEAPHHVGQCANVVHNVLARYDLPDLAAQIAPRTLTIASAAEPDGRLVTDAELAATYAAARAAYEAQNAGKALTLSG